MSLARRFTIHGKVIGVGFEAFVKASAQALHIPVRVRINPDGTVEVHAEGSEEQLRELASDLSRGPRLARISQVDAADAAVEGLEGCS